MTDEEFQRLSQIAKLPPPEREAAIAKERSRKGLSGTARDVLCLLGGEKPSGSLGKAWYDLMIEKLPDAPESPGGQPPGDSSQ